MALPMVIRAEIKNHRMVIEFTEDVADGEVTVEVTRLPKLPENPTREQIREVLLAAGILATNLGIPDDLEQVSDDELEELGRLPEGAPSSEQLVSEDRGEY